MECHHFLRRFPALLPQFLTRWLCAFILALALAVAAPANAFAAPQAMSLEPTFTSARSQTFAQTADLSTGVRVRRGGRSLDVWLVAPHSVHWAIAAVAPPLHKQLNALEWPLERSSRAAPRFERLPPGLLLRARAPRLWRKAALL